MLARVLTAVIGIPLILFFILSSLWHNIPFFIFILLLNALAQNELHKIFTIKKIRINKIYFLISGTVILLSFYLTKEFFPGHGTLPFFIYFLLIIIYFFSLIFREDYRDILQELGGLTFGLFYLPLLCGHFILLKLMPQGAYLFFLIVLLIWFNDTFAYVFGMTLGKKKFKFMASPNKSYAGLIGGLLFSVLALFVAEYIFSAPVQFSVIQKIYTGIFFGLIAFFSDLAESIIKRSVQIKDSDSLLPGHGGILDRFDSWFITIPVFYYYIYISGI